MSYINTALQPGETLSYSTTLHWIVYLKAAPALMLALAAFALADLHAEQLVPGAEAIRPGLFVASAILTTIAFGHFGVTMAKRRSTELAITSRRLIWKSGLFSRHSIAWPLDRIESIDLEQSLAGRIFNYGTIVLRGTGGNTAAIDTIARPAPFAGMITAPAPGR